MITRLENDPEGNKINGLPNLCHKLENLMQRSSIKWVEDTLEKCKSISNFVNDHSVFLNTIHTYINTVNDKTYRVIPGQCATRFAEYIHDHI